MQERLVNGMQESLGKDILNVNGVEFWVLTVFLLVTPRQNLDVLVRIDAHGNVPLNATDDFQIVLDFLKGRKDEKSRLTGRRLGR